MMNFISSFRFGDKVRIDGGSVVAVVTGFRFYQNSSQVQVSWWNSGMLMEQWVDDGRLETVRE